MAVNAVKEIITLCCETHMKFIHILCGENVDIFMLKQVVHIETT
jgi:hypothetical protein